MSTFLDTSVIVRYLIDDPAEMAAQAARLINSEVGLLVTETALAEAFYVLRRVYPLPREQVVDLLVDFLQRRNIQCHNADKGTLTTALLMCRPSGRVAIGDALIWAAAVSTNSRSTIYSFESTTDGLAQASIIPHHCTVGQSRPLLPRRSGCLYARESSGLAHFTPTPSRDPYDRFRGAN